VAVGSFPLLRSKHHATLYTKSQRVLVLMARRSFNYNFSPSFLSSTSKGVLASQSCKMVLDHLIAWNLIYLFFNFIHCHLIFYIFFIKFNSHCFDSYLFCFYYFLNWILFFDLIPNHFILIFFIEFDLHFYCCNSFYFDFYSWLIFFHPLLFNFIEFSYHIWYFFFYHTFKTWSESQPPSCPWSRFGSNNQGYRGQLNFLLCKK
jgi:hypothetical protein